MACHFIAHSVQALNLPSFQGISLEGAVIKPRRDVNAKFYGGSSDLTPRDILSGATPPPAAADPL